jgi:hypothetical protein
MRVFAHADVVDILYLWSMGQLSPCHSSPRPGALCHDAPRS